MERGFVGRAAGRSLVMALPVALVAGCGGTQPRVEVAETVAVGAPVAAVAHFDCVPGVVGCPPVDTAIERLAVEPAAAVEAVERQDRTLVFTPTAPGALRVVLDARVDDEAQRVVAAVEALVADSAALDGCPAGGALVAGVAGTARFSLTAGGRRLATRAAVFAASSRVIRHRADATYAIDGAAARAGDIVRVSSRWLPGWSAELAVVALGAIDGARLDRAVIAAGEGVEVGVAFSAGERGVCASLPVPASVTVETPEVCRVLWPERRPRTGVRVVGRSAGVCRLRFGVGAQPVARLRVR